MAALSLSPPLLTLVPRDKAPKALSTEHQPVHTTTQSDSTNQFSPPHNQTAPTNSHHHTIRQHQPIHTTTQSDSTNQFTPPHNQTAPTNSHHYTIRQHQPIHTTTQSDSTNQFTPPHNQTAPTNSHHHTIRQYQPIHTTTQSGNKTLRTGEWQLGHFNPFTSVMSFENDQ